MSEELSMAERAELEALREVREVLLELHCPCAGMTPEQQAAAANAGPGELAADLAVEVLWCGTCYDGEAGQPVLWPCMEVAAWGIPEDRAYLDWWHAGIRDAAAIHAWLQTGLPQDRVTAYAQAGIDPVEVRALELSEGEDLDERLELLAALRTGAGT